MKNYLVNNIKLKIAAVIIAVILWALVGGQRHAEVGFHVPLELKGMPGDLVMVKMPPKSIEVRLAGPESYIGDISLGQVKVVKDLSGAKDGVNRFRIALEEVSVPGTVKVVSIKPRSFEVRMEKLVTVVVPVRVNFTGTPAKGYKAISVTPEPTHVTVVGRKKDITGLKRAYTRLIDIEGFTRTGSFTVLIDAPAKVGRVEPEAVEVTVTIQ